MANQDWIKYRALSRNGDKYSLQEREMLKRQQYITMPYQRIQTLHYYRMDLLSRAVIAFSPDYRAWTTIPGLKVEPSVPGHRAGNKDL